MSIELDKIPLIKHVREDSGKTKVLNSVFNISVSERRNIVEHRVPGMEGGILQDMGRDPVRISFEGVIYGKESKETLKSLRSKFKAGKPVPFSSDLTTVAEVTQVLIEDLQVYDVSGSPNNYKYRITLREYTPPPKKDDPPPSQDEDAKKSVDQKADDSKKGVDGNAKPGAEEGQKEGTAKPKGGEEQKEGGGEAKAGEEDKGAGGTGEETQRADDGSTKTEQREDKAGTQDSGGGAQEGDRKEGDASASSSQHPSEGAEQKPGGGEGQPKDGVQDGSTQKRGGEETQTQDQVESSQRPGQEVGGTEKPPGGGQEQTGESSTGQPQPEPTQRAGTEKGESKAEASPPKAGRKTPR